MQARVKWVEGLTFIGESASGHQILMDGNSGDKAPSPMEMVLMAAGGCSAIDVVSILQKGRHNVTNCEVKLTSERREEAPRLFTHINMHFIVTGKELKDAAVSPCGGSVGGEILLGGADAAKSGEHHPFV
ncbi:OsmC-like protein [Raoultella ornithinolytica]|nr:OsmC-like protein [Raoultella ornithinolytica]